MDKAITPDTCSSLHQLQDPSWRELHVGGPSDELKIIANHTRQVFLAMLEDSMPGKDTEGACAYATLLLKSMLFTHTEFTTTPKGGDGQGDGGYFDATRGHGHYWLEVDTPAGAYVVDITADQFGADPVVVVPANNPQYVPGNQQLVDEQFIEFTQGILS